MVIKRQLKKLRSTKVGRWLNVPLRIRRALPIAGAPLSQMASWAFASKEDTNFTYELTELNIRHRAHAVAAATGTEWQKAKQYIDEVRADKQLAEHVIRQT